VTDGGAPEATAPAAARAFDLRRLPDEFYEDPFPFYWIGGACRGNPEGVVDTP
jgi:hypothetical protein